MQLNVFEDHHSLSLAVANRVIELVKANPKAVICFASGETPKLTCQLLTVIAMKQKTSFSQCTFIGLDEWVGIPPENEGSCHYFFKNQLFNHLDFSPSQIHLFDALSNDLFTECKKMDKAIADHKGIDLMIVGIGMNGHIGFNEPGISFDNYSHVADLDKTTLSVGKKYFNSPVPLNKGITLGLKHLTESKEVILMANGSKKAEVIKKTIEGAVTNSFPASIMQTHPNGSIKIDKEAASLLKQ